MYFIFTLSMFFIFIDIDWGINDMWMYGRIYTYKNNLRYVSL